MRFSTFPPLWFKKKVAAANRGLLLRFATHHLLSPTELVSQQHKKWMTTVALPWL
jgi:hypothetical protein